MTLGENMCPMEPQRWSTRYLLVYSVLHGLVSGAQGTTMSKEMREELELKVAADMRSFYAKNDLAPNAVAPCDALDTDPEQLLVRRAQPDCAELFRQNPEKLETIFEAGLSRLVATQSCDLKNSAAGLLPLLEWWLFFTLDTSAWQQLESQGVPRVCGRTLTRHDATVYCMECGVDTQCVFCADCFQNSPCVGHRHVVRQGSGNGGICDCGDPTAWNPASFCKRHKGFHKSDDPTAGMPPVFKRWLEVVTRGLILYQVTVMRMFLLGFCESTANWTNGSARWFDRLFRRTTALTLQLVRSGEGSRRIMCLALAGNASVGRQMTTQADGEKTTAVTPLSCVEEIFLNNIKMSDTKELIIWEKSFLFLLDCCVSDPIFRIPLAELLLKYSERLSMLHGRHVETLSVQVLTVKDVVDALLRITPQQGWERVLGRETILHRQLSALLYMCCHVKKHRRWMPVNSTSIASYCCQRFRSTIGASPNTKAMLVSRLMFRAWCKVLTMVGSSSVVRREVGSFTSGKFTIDTDYAMTMHLELQRVFYTMGNMVHEIGLALKSGAEPLPDWLLESLQSLPLAWEALPDPSIDYSYHRNVLDALALQHAPALLLNVNVEDHGGPLRAYMRELLMESVESINSVLAEKRSAFVPVVFVLSGQDEEHHLPQYDLLDQKSVDSTSFVIPHMRFFAVLVKVWTRLHQQEEETKHSQRGGACEAGTSAGESEEAEPFYSLISEVFAATRSRPDYWLDECLMPLVLLGQVEQGLWRRDDCDVERRCGFYMEDVTLGVETDLYLLQLLLLIIPTEAFAIQVLQRHVPSGEKVDRALCHPSFLRLILTLSVAECGAAVNNVTELRKAVQQRMVHDMVTEPNYSFHIFETDASEFADFLPGVDPKEMLPSILNEIAVGVQQQQHGQVFRLRDAETWRANVNLYHPIIRDRHSYDMYDVYKRLVRREWVAQKRTAQDAAASKEPLVMFPPPKLLAVGNDRRQLRGCQAALYHKICLLLQTSAVLSVAIDVVHLFLHHVVRGKHDREDDCMNKRTLAHAVTILYLSMSAAKAISSVESPAGAADAIDWEAVERFQNRFISSSGYMPNQLQQLYPVCGIMDAATLRHKLQLCVYRGDVGEDAVAGAEEVPQGMTTVAALFELRTYFAQAGGDEYSLVEMVEFILQGVSALSPSHAESEARGWGTQCEQEDQRRRRIKERQMALLQRVKANDAKSITALSNNTADKSIGDDRRTREISTIDDGSGATSGNNNNNHTNISSGCPAATGDVAREETSDIAGCSQCCVMARILLRLSETECCMCRSSSDEPLLLLGNISASDSLYRLGFYPSGDTDTAVCRLSTHLYVCGHAAHKTCVAKTFGRLANTWARETNSTRLLTALAPLEFNCPICVMICTTLCPLPTLITHVNGENFSPPLSTSETSSTTSSPPSLFEAVQRDTLRVLMSHETTTTVLHGMHEALAYAAIGRSKMDRVGDFLLEPGELQQRNPSLWTLVETLRSIRTQLCIAVEWVMVGGKVQYNELLGLLTLMVSLDTNVLNARASALLEELHNDGDGLCLLLLKLLQNPREAVVSLAQYTSALLASSDHPVLLYPPEKDDGGVYRNLLISVWKELGCLSLLKVLFSGTAPTGPSQCMDGRAIVVPVESSSLATLEGQQRAVLTLVCYLLEQHSFLRDQEGNPGVALASLVRVVVAKYKESTMGLTGLPSGKLLRCKPVRIPYDGPASWRRYILRHLFHLSDTLWEMLLATSSSEPCDVCGDTEARRVICCFCGQRLCARPVLTPPELYAHARTCGRGIGIYVHPMENVFSVLLTVSGCYVRLPCLYADEYGQKSIYNFSGHEAFIDDGAATFWLSLWMRSRWEVESTVVKRLERKILRLL